MSDSETGEQWLEDVRRAYLATAERKVSDLGRAIDDLEAAPESLQCRQNLRTLLHNLVGSGASYGFASVSAVARRLSSALKRARTERMISETDLIGLLRNGVDDLREAFERERTAAGGESGTG